MQPINVTHNDTDARTPSAQARWATHVAVPAAVAGYPLLEALRTCCVQTAPGAPAYGRAPFNTFGHSARPWTDRDRDIVTPANDLLYSNAWVDLREGPVLLDVPAATGRYFVVELLDVYTNNFCNLGTRNVPADGARYALLGPDTPDAAAPAGSVPLRCPTALVWVLCRVLVDGEGDVPAARGFQSGFVLTGAVPAAPPASIARWQEGGDAALDFYANLARALADFPPPESERGVYALLGNVHVRLQADGGLGDLRPAVVEGLREAHATATALIEGHTRSVSKAAWRFSTRLGRYRSDLMLRAATAWKGLGALAADEAIYALADYDRDGAPLDGSRRYTLCFADGGDLPADAFWSISLYGADRYFAANDIGRHALGNRSALERAADGSLTLEVSHARPLGPECNWLPAPDGPFYLILRLYHPQPQLFEGRYRFPDLEHVA